MNEVTIPLESASSTTLDSRAKVQRSKNGMKWGFYQSLLGCWMRCAGIYNEELPACLLVRIQAVVLVPAFLAPSTPPSWSPLQGLGTGNLHAAHKSVQHLRCVRQSGSGSLSTSTSASACPSTSSTCRSARSSNIACARRARCLETLGLADGHRHGAVEGSPSTCHNLPSGRGRHSNDSAVLDCFGRSVEGPRDGLGTALD